jgi:hypothetical protein
MEILLRKTVLILLLEKVEQLKALKTKKINSEQKTGRGTSHQTSWILQGYFREWIVQ